MSDLRILDQEIYNVKDKIFFVMNSVNEPTNFIKCYGEIIRKNVKQLNIVYAIRLLKIVDDKDNIKRNFHMKDFNVQYEKSGIFAINAFNVLDIVNDIDFDTKLAHKTRKVLFHTTSYLSSRDQNQMNMIYDSTKEIAKQYLQDKLLNL